MLLYINKQLVDLDSNQTIAQTKQVNDLNSLDNRQASYTNKFRLPKTANNIRIMGFLTLAGNNSDIPYQHNECSLYSDNGECFVYNGRAVVTDGGDNFDVVIYDGIIDLYKAIENKNLSSLALKEIGHVKDLSGVADTWNPSHELFGKCQYILADYNGKTGYAPQVLSFPQRVSIDYLVPSVNVAWLWGKIFSTYGIGYSGSVFHTQQFKNLWMTYPKGIITQDDGTEVFSCDTFGFANKYYQDFGIYWKTYLFKYATEDTGYLEYFDEHPQHYKLTAKESGYYRIDLSCNIQSRESVRLFVVKNVSSTDNAYLDSLTEYKYFTEDLPKNTDFEGSVVVKLQENESISLMMRHHNGVRGKVYLNNGSEINLTITKINLAGMDFGGAFADFSIRDFLSEVIYRFGLTLFKDKYENRYEFLTLQEILQSPDPADLSRKFVKKISENYIYGSYAQNNWFRYNYNDKEDSHNDACVRVLNVNLAESRDMIKSKVYSPEKETSGYLRRNGNIYKLWDKEVDDDPNSEEPVKYKSLDKRYYLLRAEPVKKNLLLSFRTTEQSALSDNYWVENYWKLSFSDSIADYYSTLGTLLNKSQLVTAELYFTDSDIANFDFRKLYYIEQLGGYFLMNKISNYIPGRPVKCELVHISAYSREIEAPKEITMTKVMTGNGFIDVYFTTEGTPELMMLNVTRANGQPLASKSVAATIGRIRYALTIPGTYYITLQADGYTTAPVEIKIPNNSTTLLP